MNDILIPTRPTNDGDFKIAKADKELLCYVVAMGVANEVAFGRWHPEFLDGSGKLSKAGKQACGQFFRYHKHCEFQDAYRQTLTGLLGKADKSDKSHGLMDEIDESRKEKALKALLSQAMSLVEGGTDLSADSLKTISEIFTKLKLIKQEEDITEKPRRYLPELCSRCQYRLFCEQCIENGEIENECLRCKALAIAKEHGYIYDPTKNLQIEKDNE